MDCHSRLPDTVPQSCRTGDGEGRRGLVHPRAAGVLRLLERVEQLLEGGVLRDACRGGWLLPVTLLAPFRAEEDPEGDQRRRDELTARHHVLPDRLANPCVANPR